VALVSFHPVTLELEQTKSQVANLLGALDRDPDLQLLFTYPGADPNSAMIIRAFEEYVSKRPNAVIFRNLGSRRYLSALKHAALMIGNSSSGIWEAPSFGLPAVNIGTRQGGRMRAANVIDVDYSIEQIASAIGRASDSTFRASIAGQRNPYGDGDSSRQIVRILSTIDPRELKYKPFFDEGKR
jgi:UDP-hydrolysing UDP-N-acetyl-D-glucosamine 2-epimerase